MYINKWLLITITKSFQSLFLTLQIFLAAGFARRVTTRQLSMCEKIFNRTKSYKYTADDYGGKSSALSREIHILHYMCNVGNVGNSLILFRVFRMEWKSYN